MSDGSKVSIHEKELTLAEAKQVALEKMAEGTTNTEMFPLLITGDIFSSVNRIADNRYLVYIIDPNLMSPLQECSGFIKANLEGNWVVMDRISGKQMGSLSQPLQIDVPVGSFKILEVYKN